MADATRALQSIPFSSLIGGPLDAAINAQARAAMSSVNFIQSIGFNDKNEVNNITFSVRKGSSVTKLEIPLLTIVPIPFLRIDEMTINFKANITSSESSEDKTTQSQAGSVKTSAGGSYWFVKASIDASYSTKKDSTSSRDSKYSVEHTVDVRVHAVQDDVPGGLARMLAILTKTIEEPPGGTGVDTGGTSTGK